MSKEYDDITAFHYAAYRPPLHKLILEECLEKKKQFSLGLDVGCGTGYSCIALSDFCEQIIGIEPSEEMFQKAMPHPKVNYENSDLFQIGFPEKHFDIITFAGSLFYAKSQALLDETIKVSKDDAKIVVYDFEILLNVIFKRIKIDLPKETTIEYDHQINFDDLSSENLRQEKAFKKTISLNIPVANVAHLLLSAKDNYNLIAAHFEEKELHKKVSEELLKVFESDLALINADIYASVYQVKK